MRDPAFHAAGQADLLAYFYRGLRAKTGNLPVMENPKVIEFFLNRWRYVPQFLEVIGDTAQALTDIIDADRATRLEAAIVILIVLELIAAIVQIALATRGR